MRHRSFYSASCNTVCGRQGGRCGADLLSFIHYPINKPNILLPATTALATLDEKGCEKGILAGANVVMPNLSPMSAKQKYELYDNKAYGGSEAAKNVEELKVRMGAIGYRVVTDRGDVRG